MENVIKMMRGDNYSFGLTIWDNLEADGTYELKEGDAIYFGIMDPHQPFEFALVRKKFTIDDCDAQGNLTIEIFPEDTIDLVPGKYYYEVKLLKAATLTDIERVTTIIPKTKFIICD